jgi:hypothetical protein
MTLMSFGKRGILTKIVMLHRREQRSIHARLSAVQGGRRERYVMFQAWNPEILIS